MTVTDTSNTTCVGYMHVMQEEYCFGSPHVIVYVIALLSAVAFVVMAGFFVMSEMQVGGCSPA